MNARVLIIFITVITIISLTLGKVSAATPTTALSGTPTPTISGSVIDKLKQIEALKEKIATKVAQLRESERGGLSGVIKSISDNTIILTTKSEDKTFSYSEDTIFFKMSNGVKSDPIDFKQAKKLKNGDQLSVLGYYDSTRANFAAKYIYMESPAIPLIGKIADIDKTNYTITVIEPKGNTLVDIETYTKIYSYDEKNGLARSGFSKLAENNIVHIFATPNPKEENRVSAVKIISLNFAKTPAASPSVTVKEASPTAKSTK